MDRRTFMQKATALGLTAATVPTRKLLASSVPETQIRGHVVSAQRPLADVCVSDGYRVVRTDSSGQFSLPVGPNSGPFLFVTTPTGHWTDRFYVPTAAAVAEPPVFRLLPVADPRRYAAIYLTDVHLGENRAEESYRRYQATIEEINRMDPLPAFCWVGGDITLQGGKGQRYVELMSQLKVPVRTAVGNHEMLVGNKDPRDRFQELFGPTYYSFNVGNVHYVTLDGCRIQPEAEGYKNVEGVLSDRELHWLQEDLQQTPAEMPVVLAIHIPLVTNFPERRGTTARQVPYWVVQNNDQVIDLLARRGVSLVLQGHLHENERMVRQGIEFVESISVSGRWWRSPQGMREFGASGEPRGYRVLEIEDTTIRHYYQSSAESRVSEAGEIVGRPEHLPPNQDARLSVNIFDAAPQTTVLGQVDDRSPQPLRSGDRERYLPDLRPAHHWDWHLAAEWMTAGKHRLKVLVEQPGRPQESFEHLVTV